MTTDLQVDVRDAQGASVGTATLPAHVFDVQVNVPLIHQVVVAQLAAARQGTHDTKNRGEVRGGGRKPYRQKGTGRARQGSTRAPQFAGGGVVHGPTPRSYAQRTPKKMKAAALRGALSDRARNGRIHVVSGLLEGDVPSTRSAVAALAGLSERRHVLVVAQRSDELSWKSLRNSARVHLLAPDQLNTYDVLVSDDVVFTQAALQEFLAGPVTGRSSSAVATESEVEA
ncbi:MAG: 50S ribosomal protein L4 [Sporichthyaceae bacterium]|nr:50S ribosomal protein L4 [Sporichthyaceae bacterium]